jgi:hypothetical protein
MEPPVNNDLSIWTATRKASLLAKLERMPPSRLPTIPQPLRNIYAARIARAIQFVGIGVSLLLIIRGFSATKLPGDGFFWSLAIILVAVLMLMFFAADFIGTSHTARFIKRFWAVPLNRTQAEDVRAWAKLYPQVRQACIRWGASRSSQNLNSIDYKRIERICKKIEGIEEQLSMYKANNTQTDEVLDDGGLLSEIRASHAQSSLEASTKPAPSSAPPPMRI